MSGTAIEFYLGLLCVDGFFLAVASIGIAYGMYCLDVNLQELNRRIEK